MDKDQHEDPKLAKGQRARACRILSPKCNTYTEPLFPRLRDSCERGGVRVATIQTVNEYRETVSSGHKAVVILVILGTVTVGCTCELEQLWLYM